MKLTGKDLFQYETSKSFKEKMENLYCDISICPIGDRLLKL